MITGLGELLWISQAGWVRVEWSAPDLMYTSKIQKNGQTTFSHPISSISLYWQPQLTSWTMKKLDENTQEGKPLHSFSRDVIHPKKMPQSTKKYYRPLNTAAPTHPHLIPMWCPRSTHISFPHYSPSCFQEFCSSRSQQGHGNCGVRNSHRRSVKRGDHPISHTISNNCLMDSIHWKELQRHLTKRWEQGSLKPLGCNRPLNSCLSFVQM